MPTQLCLCLNHKQKINFFQIKNILIFLRSLEKFNPNILAQGLVVFYQATFSYFLGGNCRYFPSCSHYAYEAYSRHGAVSATWMVLKRLLSCQPFSKKSFYDPVPYQSDHNSAVEKSS
ncbi:MAG: membrane protein insertion efficiency factor YidD [Bdellovibrionota bacterium]